MPRLSKQIFLPHDAADLFDLVSDIRRYPEFIIWIKTMHVFNEVQTADLHTCTGEAEVGFKAFTTRFATHVKSDRVNYRIEASLVDGPFHHLENSWRFTPCHDGGTHVDFFIDYIFKNRLLALLARANSQRAADRIMAAFTTEADRRFRS